MFEEIKSYLGYKLGGISEVYLDIAPLKKGYWRLTTQDNYAFHMGNTHEDWMQVSPNNKEFSEDYISNFKTNKKTSLVIYFLKNRLFIKVFSIVFFNNLFLKWKGLPKTVVKRY